MITFSGTRFRWRQELEETEEGDPEPTQWALKDVYVGEACENYCSGHGFCQYPQCICDYGYTGSDCSHLNDTDKPVSRYMHFFKSLFETHVIERINGEMDELTGGHTGMKQLTSSMIGCLDM